MNYFKNNRVAKVLSHLKAIQNDLVSKPWVLMDRPALDPTKLAEAVRKKHKERDDMLNLCQSSLVRKMQGRTGEIIERPGWKVANDADIRGACIAANCSEVAPFVCSMGACKAYCCSIHGPDHHLHAVWATADALTTQRDQRKAAVAIANPAGGRGRGGRGRTSSRGGRASDHAHGSMNGDPPTLGDFASNNHQARPRERSTGGSRGEAATRGRGRAGVRGRGGRGRGGGGRGGDAWDLQDARGNRVADASALVPPEEGNPLAILAGLLRSHPNLLSQLTSMGSADDSAESALDEWII